MRRPSPSPGGRTSSRGRRGIASRKPAADAAADESAGEKRRRIRVAAYRCFLRRGFHETTVDAICERAGISKGAFYWYFPSKQAVFLDLLNAWADAVHAELTAELGAALRGPEPVAALRATLERELRRGHHIMPVWLEFLAQLRRDDEVRAGIAQFHRRARQGIFNFFLPLLTPEFTEDDVRVFAGALLSAFIGLVCQDLVDPNGAQPGGQLEQFITMTQLFIRRAKPDGWELTRRSDGTARRA
jgi:AcrR family transcriptional regulator